MATTTLAFVGGDSEWQSLARAAATEPTFRLLRPAAELEDILAQPGVDAVILGGPHDERAHKLRRILQAGRSCLCLHPVDTSPIFYEEAALLAADAKVALVPFLPGRLHPAWHRLVELCESGAIGSLRLATIERAGALPRDRRMLGESYAEVVDLLGLVIGDVSELTTTGELAGGRLVVQHRATTGCAAEVRLNWSSSDADRWRVAIDGERGSVELVFGAGLDGPATLHWKTESGTESAEFADPQLAGRMLAEFRRALAGEPHRPTWSDATRAVELADWAWYSLDRRRSVDVIHEERSELASFKGRMTSLGCGLIWLTLVVVIFIAAGKGLGLPGTRAMAIGLVLVWLIFLGLQSLRWILSNDYRGR